MAKEKERKFLLKEIPSNILEQHSTYSRELIQGYLFSEEEFEVRVRWDDGEGTITTKIGNGEIRSEYEKEMNAGLVEDIIDDLDNCVWKERYDCGRWEIDRYTGERFDGLWIAEIELHETELYTNDLVPEWLKSYIVRDVTNDPLYKNKRLAYEGLPR